MKQTERNIGKRIVLGVIVTLTVYFGLLAFSAFLIEQGRIGEGDTEHCVILCAFLSAFTGVKTAACGLMKLPIFTMVCIGAVYCVAILIAVLINDTLSMRRTAELAASMTIGGGCAVLLRIGKRGGKHIRHTKK